MDFLLDMHFIVGLLVGALVYHLWMMRKAHGAAA